MDIKELALTKDKTVIQANELLRAKRDDLSLSEAKILALTISQIVKADNDLLTYSCPIDCLADFLGISKNNLYRDYTHDEKDEVCIFGENLLKKVVYFQDKEKPFKRNGKPNYKLFQWFTLFECTNGIITVRLNQELKPFLLGLNRLFTQYGYESILYLPTYYSIRLYELLASFRNTIQPNNPDFINLNPQYPNIPIEKNELLFSIQYLRHYFNCSNKYPQTGDFMKWVIESSVKGINKNSPSMRLSYRTIKSGRSITHVAFKILIDFETMNFY